jgi:hypothetical protein
MSGITLGIGNATKNSSQTLRPHIVPDSFTKIKFPISRSRPAGPPADDENRGGLGHTMLVGMYHMQRDGVDYKELGPDYLDKLQPQRLTYYLVKRLESLGHVVTLSPIPRAA